MNIVGISKACKSRNRKANRTIFDSIRQRTFKQNRTASTSLTHTYDGKDKTMLTTGQRVKVMFPERELAVTPYMRQHFQGVETRIKEVVPVRGAFKTYILEGCVSDFGNDFHFVDEWLIPLDVKGEDSDG